MKNKIVNASLVDETSINVVYYCVNENKDITFYLNDKNENKIDLKISSFSKKSEIIKYQLKSEINLALGMDYVIHTNDEDSSYLDYEDYINGELFEQKYRYPNNDLGPSYTKTQTTFKVYSPLASRVILELQKNEKNSINIEMTRMNYGIFEVVVKGDLKNKFYRFRAVINGKSVLFKDLYAKSVSFNSKYSAVIDVDKLHQIKSIRPKNDTSLKNSVIYEVDIRDFNSDTKPTYLNFIKKIPYLKSLGVDYVQLLPVLDFANVDDEKNDTYNWGYDVTSFFALEGSYSSNPSNPFARMSEFKEMVNALHKENIKVIMDVVYNHVYKFENSDFEKSFPDYYFRKQGNKHYNGSGCGNDFASERYMARKIIKDSLEFLTKTYDIDGFRFDLLGLIDIQTVNEINESLKNINPDILLYGEGWDILTGLKKEEKTCLDNAKKVSSIGFFNPEFRDVIKGDTFNQNDKGYAAGNLSLAHKCENVILGSYLNGTFSDSSQTINYVECHDNQTLFDRLNANCEDKNIVLRQVKFANILTVISLGRPLIHMGQEHGQSKFGLGNTYNMLNVNNMNWTENIERQSMVKALSDAIKFRHSYDIFDLCNKDEIVKTFEVFQHSNGLCTIKVVNEKYLYGHKDIICVINPTGTNQTLMLDEYYKLFFDTNGLITNNLLMKNLISDPYSVKFMFRD